MRGNPDIYYIQHIYLLQILYDGGPAAVVVGTSRPFEHQQMDRETSSATPLEYPTPPKAHPAMHSKARQPPPIRPPRLPQRLPLPERGATGASPPRAVREEAPPPRPPPPPPPPPHPHSPVLRLRCQCHQHMWPSWWYWSCHHWAKCARDTGIGTATPSSSSSELLELSPLPSFELLLSSLDSALGSATKNCWPLSSRCACSSVKRIG